MGSRSTNHQRLHYSIRSAEGTYIGGSQQLHDLNTVESRQLETDGIGDAVVTDDNVDDDDDEGRLHSSYRNSMTFHEGKGERSDIHRSCEHSSRSPACDILNINDVMPIESARARFLQVFVDHFISKHLVEVADSVDVEYGRGQDKLNKRNTTKETQIQYEGDPNYVLPLMYIANLYETLVNDVNICLATLDGARGKTIGVALEAAGGLYRKLATKFPRKGNCSFRRRELATSSETRARFPELVVQEEKRVRFVVVNGLAIVERPETMSFEDAVWFKRLTGRSEISVSERDYKFYTPRHKYRRVVTTPVSCTHSAPEYNCNDGSSVGVASAFRPGNEPQNLQQIQFSALQQAHHQSTRQTESTSQFSNVHQCPNMSSLSEDPEIHQSSTIPQNITCIQSLSGGHIGGRLLSSPKCPAKFCDECGTPYVRETSKYCSECGVKRLGI